MKSMEGLDFIAWICLANSREDQVDQTLYVYSATIQQGFKHTGRLQHLQIYGFMPVPVHVNKMSLNQPATCPPPPPPHTLSLTPPPPSPRRPYWHRWTMTWFVRGAGLRTGSQWAEASTCPTSRPPRGVRSCCGRASRGRRRTPRPCPSGSSVCSWGRSSDWGGPSPPTPPSSESLHWRPAWLLFFFF